LEIAMNAGSWLASAGLLGVVSGFLVTNLAVSPRAAQTGIGLATGGVLMLAAMAVGRLLA
jgi:hypothetical protein